MRGYWQSGTSVGNLNDSGTVEKSTVLSPTLVQYQVVDQSAIASWNGAGRTDISIVYLIDAMACGYEDGCGFFELVPSNGYDGGNDLNTMYTKCMGYPNSSFYAAGQSRPTTPLDELVQNPIRGIRPSIATRMYFSPDVDTRTVAKLPALRNLRGQIVDWPEKEGNNGGIFQKQNRKYASIANSDTQQIAPRVILPDKSVLTATDLEQIPNGLPWEDWVANNFHYTIIDNDYALFQYFRQIRSYWEPTELMGYFPETSTGLAAQMRRGLSGLAQDQTYEIFNHITTGDLGVNTAGVSIVFMNLEESELPNSWGDYGSARAFNMTHAYRCQLTMLTTYNGDGTYTTYFKD